MRTRHGWTLAGLTFFTALTAQRAAALAAPAPLHAQGNVLVDDHNQVVRLRGVNVPSLEWGDGEPNAYSTPKPCWQGQSIVDSVVHALDAWHANIIRLPINPDRWWSALGNDGTAYRKLVDLIVATAAARNAYVIVDLHWSDAGQWGRNSGQHNMPDDNTQTVLQDVAGHFANNPAVFIGAYNEPHDVDWNTWKNGGTVYEGGLSYHTPGLQAMVQTVRQQGAKNVVVVGGLGWAYDLTGIAQGYALADDNVMYDAHVYPFKGGVADWDANVTVAAAHYPVFIGEFGAFGDGVHDGAWSSPHDYIASLQSWLDAHDYSFTAWTFAPVAPPTLLADWCFTPSQLYGQYIDGWLSH